MLMLADNCVDIIIATHSFNLKFWFHRVTYVRLLGIDDSKNQEVNFGSDHLKISSKIILMYRLFHPFYQAWK